MLKKVPTGGRPKPNRIVSSHHLVSAVSPELSEFEYGMIVAWNGFSRWTMRCMAAIGFEDMTTIDVLVLHHVVHRDNAKRLADICFVLNVEDTHVVSYSLKKLVGLDLVSSQRKGKEALYSATERGRDACMRYREVREACLMPGFSGAEAENQQLGELARMLRTLSGRYDQAARAATTSTD